MEKNRIFTTEELELAKELAYVNCENQEETVTGFEFKGQWITNPFVEVSGRFEFTDLDALYEYYGKENVYNLIKKLLEQGEVKNRMMKRRL